LLAWIRELSFWPGWQNASNQASLSNRPVLLRKSNVNKTRFLQRSFLLPTLFLLTGCAAAQATPTPTPTFRTTPNLTFTATPVFPLQEGAIIFEIDLTRKFAGHVYGQGETAIILANMSSGGETQWDPFVQALDKDRFTIITFNYLRPDYMGASQDVSTVLERLRQVGYKRVVCIGASLGVTACGSIPLAPEMVGMVMIAGPNYGQPVTASYPKLFIAAADDPWSRDTENAYKTSSEPRQLVIYQATGIHGTGLFYSNYKDQFLKTLVDFVNNLP
jgi:hypothetical protein